jgi:N-carbamoylputrescine amidase
VARQASGTSQIRVEEELKLCAIQMNSQVNGRDANVAKACQLIDEAMVERPDLIVLPEFFNTEYFAQYRDYAYLAYAEPETGYTMTAITAKATEHQVHIVAPIYELAAPGVYFDTAMIIGPDGEILGKYRKTHPAAGRGLEKIYFKRGSRYPVFDLLGWKAGVIICYDWAFPEAARCVAVQGAELILVPFAYAFPRGTPGPDMWDRVLTTRAWENGVFLAACNKVGQEGDWVFGGRSLIVDPFGNILAEAGAEKDETIFATIRRDTLAHARRVSPTWRDRRPEIYRPLCAFEEDLGGSA